MMIEINSTLVQRLVADQFPAWADLAIRPVSQGGHDNRTFHLGERMLVRMPSAACYAPQIKIEQQWLPKLAPQLPLSIPTPLGLGTPTKEFPWHWSIYTYIDGETASRARISNLNQCAKDLAQFLLALQRIESEFAPIPGEHNFYRGANPIAYDRQLRQMLSALKTKIDVKSILEIWELAIASNWQGKSVWTHGDISTGNLLINDGSLVAVIDFGQAAAGDPACDLVIAWTLFKDESRAVFKDQMSLDANTWIRAHAWLLWKTLTQLVDVESLNRFDLESHVHLIDEVIADHHSGA